MAPGQVAPVLGIPGEDLGVDPALPIRVGLGWVGLVRVALARVGLVWVGLVRVGLARVLVTGGGCGHT